MDALAYLTADHDTVRRLLDELEQHPAPERRRDTVESLITAVARHESIEEQYLWPTVRTMLPDGDVLADPAVGQVALTKDLLDRLDARSAADPGYEGVLGALVAACRGHIEFQESTVWPKLRTVLSEPERAALGAELERAKNLTPQRPHPRTEAHPVVEHLQETGAAIMDRVRHTVAGHDTGDEPGTRKPDTPQ